MADEKGSGDETKSGKEEILPPPNGSLESRLLWSVAVVVEEMTRLGERDRKISQALRRQAEADDRRTELQKDVLEATQKSCSDRHQLLEEKVEDLKREVHAYTAVTEEEKRQSQRQFQELLKRLPAVTWEQRVLDAAQGTFALIQQYPLGVVIALLLLALIVSVVTALGYDVFGPLLGLPQQESPLPSPEFSPPVSS